MANQEHLNKLQEGVEAWNQWRDEHRDILPDLNYANLRGNDLNYVYLSNANLSNADLSYTSLRDSKLTHINLNYANLSNTDLGRADLIYANLLHADLSGAKLNYAKLNYANLSNAKLSNADLRRANLMHSDLRGANLNGADLSGAILGDTVVADVDFRLVKGLLEIHHLGPSYLVLQSVQLPQDGSALHFLRGTGITDEWIDFYKATMQRPIQYHSCFISYSSDDYDIAKRLHADLQDQGVRCWFAPHDLVPGDYFREKIDQAIYMQDKLLLILSTHSMNSTWVQHEVRKALNREANQNRTILFPISLDGSVFKSPSAWAQELREERHIGDFTQWETYEVYKQKFQTLLKQLKSIEVQP